jgi:hypothetical protein
VPIQICKAAVKIMFTEEDIIFSYTTKMAVDDGVLIPIPGIISGPLGINVPVYFNDSVWIHYVDSVSDKRNCVDKTAEISRILESFVLAAKLCKSNICYFDFVFPAPLWLTNSRNEKLNPDGSLTVALKAVISAEDIDRPNPAVFFMLPWED